MLYIFLGKATVNFFPSFWRRGSRILPKSMWHMKEPTVPVPRVTKTQSHGTGDLWRMDGYKSVISYHIISYHIISYHIIYHIISYHIISYHIISYLMYRIVSYRIASHRIASHHIISHHITSSHISYHTHTPYPIINILVYTVTCVNIFRYEWADKYIYIWQWRRI